VDVRIVCATHRDLLKLQHAGTFRADLFARLNEYQLRLPPLRDRKEDLFMLVREFLRRHGRPELRPSFAFMLGLLHYDWPYNVRELEAAIKRSIALVDGFELDEEQLPAPVREAMADYGQSRGTERPSGVTPPPQAPAVRSAVPTDVELRALLEKHEGNVAAVGRELGKARMQIHRWMRRYGIEVEDFREE
jgi:DNA-binding NtrC family response regulator